MKLTSLVLVMMVGALCGCAPEASPKHAPARPQTHGSPTATAAPAAKGATPDADAPSYEVSIASAEADRVRARDLCDSGDKAERHTCIQAADAAYDSAKRAAESTRNAAP